MGLNSFEKWDTMTRTNGQSSENFLMQYYVAFHEVKKHDSRMAMSDHLLVMKGLARLQFEDKDKTQILSRMKGACQNSQAHQHDQEYLREVGRSVDGTEER